MGGNYNNKLPTKTSPRPLKLSHPWESGNVDWIGLTKAKMVFKIEDGKVKEVRRRNNIYVGIDVGTKNI